jgi:hypothetical protein
MKRTTPVEGAVSGVAQVRAMLADQAAVPMLERPAKDDPKVAAASATAPDEGAAGKATSGGAKAQGAVARRASDAEHGAHEEDQGAHDQAAAERSVPRLPPEGIAL